ncbi:molybdopterin-binding domain-containing protein [Methylobrevis albus]|uniref:Formyltransferase n=1 Tax=Methylobrevis albus TaxID=2793297 RepID=A0A931N0V6_9HYPH|nr:formyltransferase [Methylobrevis albus]MBH0239634.1 formyltransferase [Methylobrevis albus]
MSADTKEQLAGLDERIARAVGLLAKARLPLISGLGADVDAVRAALLLAQKTGAAVDHAAAAHIAVELRVTADAGHMATTSAEARNRADTVVFAGPGAIDFADDSGLFATAETPYDWRGDRTVLCLGTGGRVPSSVAAVAATHLVGGPLAGRLGALKAIVAGRTVAGADAALTAAAETLKAARFGVVVVDPADLDRFGFELLHALVKDLNDTTRFTTLPVPASHQGRGANLVSTWTTGGRLRVGFGRGYPEQDDWQFDGTRLAAAGEADVLVWVGPLGPGLPDYATNLPTIALVPPGSGATDSADHVVIEVGVPGVDHGAVLADTVVDGFSFVPASAPSALPTAAAILAAITAGLATGAS